jgi:hypothetical protein
MPLYLIRFRLSPERYFGLPEGDRTIIPSSPQREYVSPAIDTRTGKIVAHGTLSEYRSEAKAITIDHTLGDERFYIRDNFLSVSVSGATPQAAYDHCAPLVDALCQSLSLQFGDRFSAEYIGADDSTGARALVTRRRKVAFFGAAFYNLEELKDRAQKAFLWISNLDPRGRKALLYCENACILRDFANTMELPAPHSAFTEAIALLQLTKALFAILGEPGTDSDYQSRFRIIGLPADFWDRRVKPVYTIRNDEDVAHYSLDVPAEGAFAERFLEAMAVLQDAFGAHMRHRAGAQPRS